MTDANEKILPGTSSKFVEPGEKGFAKIKMLLEATGGLSLSQVCAVTGLEGSTIQNWVKRGWVAHPIGKRYEEVHIARILIINALKECIKLENIALLMDYVKGPEVNNGEEIIKESDLYNYLCDALDQSGRTDDHSRGGVESVVGTVINDYKGKTPEALVRIRKALTLMIFACVCTDVKRRTEAMMGQILIELENPVASEPAAPQPVVQAVPKAADVNIDTEITEPAVAAPPEDVLQLDIEEEEVRIEEYIESDAADELIAIATNTAETRKTISQALREWDISSVERIIIDHNEEARTSTKTPEEEDKPVTRPWFVRKGSK